MAVVALLLMNPPAEIIPMPGEWTVSTGTSSFTFTFNVSPDSTSVSIVDYELTELQIGSLAWSGYFSFDEPLTWPISGGKFTMSWSSSTLGLAIVIKGSCDETGTHASGTWEVKGGTDSQTGTWEASAP